MTSQHQTETEAEIALSTTAERKAVVGTSGAAPSKDWVIVTRGIKREYDMGGEIVRALRGVDLAVRRNEYVAIMGPSGSGKSTLMHILAGLDRPTSGSVVIDGLEITDLDDKRLTELRRERVGFVFQDFHLLPELSPLGNVIVAGTFFRSRRDVT